MIIVRASSTLRARISATRLAVQPMTRAISSSVRPLRQDGDEGAAQVMDGAIEAGRFLALPDRLQAAFGSGLFVAIAQDRPLPFPARGKRLAQPGGDGMTARSPRLRVFSTMMAFPPICAQSRRTRSPRRRPDGGGGVAPVASAAMVG